jgi:hypothetical protein
MTFKPQPKDKWKELPQAIPVTEYRENYLNKAGRKNKYGAKKQQYNGVKYDSNLEAKVAEDLDYQLKVGDLVEIKRQYKVPLMVNGVLICNWYCDFRVVDKHGQVKYVEAKGLELPVWKLKKKLFLALLQQIDPGAVLEVVK